MTNRLSLLITILAGVLLSAPALATPQDTTARAWRFTLKDGSTIVGTIRAETPDSLFITTGGGIAIGLPRSAVTGTERLRGSFENGVYRRTDPNSSRLLVGPTARPLKAGSGYFAAYEIFFTYFSVGIADFISMGGGLTLFPGASGQVFYLTPKIALTTDDERFSGAVGALYMNATSGSNEGLGIVYGVGTFGTPRAAITGGFGYGYASGEFADNPILILGGEVQAGNSFKLITENWFPLESDFSLLSFGFRFFGDRLAADLGFFYPMRKGSGISQGFPFIPWLGFAYNFGQ